MVASIQGSINIDGGNPVSGSKTGQWRKMWRRLISNNLLVQFTIVSCKYAPPFATLALVQNAGGGGAYMRDVTRIMVASF